MGRHPVMILSATRWRYRRFLGNDKLTGIRRHDLYVSSNNLAEWVGKPGLPGIFQAPEVDEMQGMLGLDNHSPAAQGNTIRGRRRKRVALSVGKDIASDGVRLAKPG